METKIKRFHINSSIDAEREVSLPRINTKVSSFDKVNRTSVKQEAKQEVSRR
jgi:hypothetical protein